MRNYNFNPIDQANKNANKASRNLEEAALPMEPGLLIQQSSELFRLAKPFPNTIMKSFRPGFAVGEIKKGTEEMNQQEYKWDVDRQCWHDPVPAGYKPWEGPGLDMKFVRTVEPSSILDEWAEIYVQKDNTCYGGYLSDGSYCPACSGTTATCNEREETNA